jgi:DNA-directed RNA polymerase specialized sigma24 family protein
MAQANTEQLIAAFSTLTELDLLILRKMAASLIGGTSFSEPLDLLHEAFGRCLDGRRDWPMQAVPFSVFLGNVMRSVASGERKKSRRLGSLRVDFDEFVDGLRETGAASAPSAEDEALEAEQIRLTGRMADDLRRKLEGDDGAQKVLNGIASGLTPKEMRESFHMDAKAFDAAMQRIRRRARQARMH